MMLLCKSLKAPIFLCFCVFAGSVSAQTGMPIVNMVDTGIIDPVLVTKSALKNAVSVALTIMSADCVISNVRIPNASS